MRLGLTRKMESVLKAYSTLKNALCARQGLLQAWR